MAMTCEDTPILGLFGSTDPWFISRSPDLNMPLDLRIYVCMMHLMFVIPRRHRTVERLIDGIVKIL